MTAPTDARSSLRRCTRVVLTLGVALLCAPAGAHARQVAGESVAVLLARADSAWERGDRSAARAGYLAVLAAAPNQSRAVFQLAMLESSGSTAALQGFRRYTELEPADPWGWMALGDAFRHARRFNDAIAQYDHAVTLAPAARDVVIERARLLALAERTDAAIVAYEAWVDGHPDDVEAWAELARQRTRAGRHREAVDALERALARGPDTRLQARLAMARAGAAPAVAPIVTGSRDSDGNTTLRTGIEADIGVARRARVGVTAARTSADDVDGEASVNDVRLSLFWQPLRAFRLTASGGIALYEGGPEASTSEPAVRVRTQWRAPGHGAAVDLQLQRGPLPVTRALVTNAVIVEEARAVLEVPVAGPVRVRAIGRGGRLLATDDDNTRTSIGGGLAVQASPLVEVSATAHRLAYDHASQVGYFAPAEARVAEVGTYFEVYPGDVTIAVDAAAGLQAVREHGAETDAWQPAFRLWSLVAWRMAPALELRAEVDAYQSQLGEAVSAGERWRYAAGTLSVRWMLPWR